MKVRVLFFASFREGAGIQEETVELEAGSGLQDLKKLLKSRHPGIENLWDIAVFSVNRAYADPGQELIEGDEVAIFPPISGG